MKDPFWDLRPANTRKKAPQVGVCEVTFKHCDCGSVEAGQLHRTTARETASVKARGLGGAGHWTSCKRAFAPSLFPCVLPACASELSLQTRMRVRETNRARLAGVPGSARYRAVLQCSGPRHACVPVRVQRSIGVAAAPRHDQAVAVQLPCALYPRWMTCESMAGCT